MTKWMIFLRGETAPPLLFRLVAALDLNVAIEIGKEIGTREGFAFVGVAPFNEPDIGS